MRIAFQHLSRIWLLLDQVRLLSKIVTLHASHKQSALHKLIKFNHTTLKRKTARHMLFHLISPSPYTIRNLPQLLQPTDFRVQKHRGGKKTLLELIPKRNKQSQLNLNSKIKSDFLDNLKKVTALLQIFTGYNQMLSCHFLFPVDTIQIDKHLMYPFLR